jgi:monoamine oxidase
MGERVVVVGAGIAGLAAACELAKAGLQPLVLEARPRVGGRIHTLSTRNGAPIELGAEFLHGLAPEVERFIWEHHLAKRQISDDHWRVRNGSFEELPNFWEKLAKVFDKIPKRGRDGPYAEFVAKIRGVDEQTTTLVDDFVEGFHAADPQRISVQSIAESEEAAEEIDGTKQFRLVAGYSEMVRAMQAEAVVRGAGVLLSHAVSRVEWHRGNVRITARTHDELVAFNADCAVITLPVGVLQAGSVVFDPPLPKHKRAVASVAMGNVVKVNLTLKPGLWPEERQGFIHLATERFPTWWRNGQVVTAWVGGPKADAHRSSLETITTAIESLSAIFGRDARPFVESAQFHNWRNDPFAYGAYSYVPVGGLEARKVLTRPVQGTLFFAGEATASAGFQGTVHGALESGLRAARQVLDAKGRGR